MIVELNKDRYVLFSNIKKGETFRYGCKIYMKTDECRIGTYHTNAVVLESGSHAVFSDKYELMLVHMKCVEI